MADNRPKEFTSYKEAMKYAEYLSHTHCGVRYVGPVRAGVWVVGTYGQLHKQMGLAPLVAVGKPRKVRRTPEEQYQIYTYWRNTGNIKATAKKFQCTENNIYRIIHFFTKPKEVRTPVVGKRIDLRGS